MLFLSRKTDRYMNQIKQGVLTTAKEVGEEAVVTSTKRFSEAQVQAELPKRIEEERPGATNMKKVLTF
jgi:hypothetical protein